MPAAVVPYRGEGCTGGEGTAEPPKSTGRTVHGCSVGYLLIFAHFTFTDTFLTCHTLDFAGENTRETPLGKVITGLQRRYKKTFLQSMQGK